MKKINQKQEMHTNMYWVERINSYLKSALENNTREISQAVVGSRNNILSSKAFSLGQIYGCYNGDGDKSIFSEYDIKSRLFNACSKMSDPLPYEEMVTTVITSFAKGMANPIDESKFDNGYVNQKIQTPLIKTLKYHVRKIYPSSNEPRFLFVRLDAGQIKEITPEIIMLLKKNGFNFSLETLQKLNVRWAPDLNALVFPWGSENVVFNPNNKQKTLYVEGRSDLIASVELGLDRGYCLVSRFNKTSKFDVTSEENNIILDGDDNSSEWLSHIVTKPDKSSFQFIKSPMGKDLRDWSRTFEIEDFNMLLGEAEKIEFNKDEASKQPQNPAIDNQEDLAIPTEVYEQLPEPLKSACQLFELHHEKEIFLMSALVALSSCLPQVFGIYDHQKTYTNLFLFIIAPAGSGKGTIRFARQLIEKINDQIRIQSKEELSFYLEQLEENTKKNGKKKSSIKNDDIPKKKSLVIPANSSATGAFELLSNNGGAGLIVETEGDTLTNTLQTDHGDYSDGLRKAFHHETISYYRRHEKEEVIIKEPKLSVLLTGTVSQVKSLIQSAENGLFSRFLFYLVDVVPEFKNVFEEKEVPLYKAFELWSNDVFEIYTDLLSRAEEIKFSFTKEQSDTIIVFFKNLQDEFSSIFGSDSVATIRRLCLIFFRIAMVLTVLRNKLLLKESNVLKCSEEDYLITDRIVSAAINHCKRILPEFMVASNHLFKKQNQNKFYDRLEVKFKRDEAISLGETFGISRATVDRLLNNDRLFKKEEYGTYAKVQT